MKEELRCPKCGLYSTVSNWNRETKDKLGEDISILNKNNNDNFICPNCSEKVSALDLDIVNDIDNKNITNEMKEDCLDELENFKNLRENGIVDELEELIRYEHDFIKYYKGDYIPATLIKIAEMAKKAVYEMQLYANSSSVRYSEENELSVTGNQEKPNNCKNCGREADESKLINGLCKSCNYQEQIDKE